MSSHITTTTVSLFLVWEEVPSQLSVTQPLVMVVQSDKTVLSFNGTNNFIINSGENDGGAIYALCLASMELTTLAATQPRMVVAVQLWQ